MSDLLSDVLAFCEVHGISHSTFGRRAVKDARFVADLQGGENSKTGKPRRLWPDTEAKVRRFMATYRADAYPGRGRKPSPVADMPQSEAA